ncbi:MAG: beta strand repeat-containing protein, partial [Verrucomicrobium sp.]
ILRATSGGTIDFRSTSGTFGTDALIKSAQANDASGILGAWATIGGGTGYASNDGTGQIIAYSGSTDIASSGAPIVNGPLTNVRFASGVGATVSLDTGSVTTINTLAQNATTAVTVDTTSKTLRLGAVGGILVTSNAGTTGTLTIGSAANVGTLTAGGTDNAPGELVLSNYSGAALTVNSVIADNSAGAVSVSRSGTGAGTGAGAVSLAGTNTYTGVTALHSGVTTVSVLANINTASSIGRGSAAGSAADLVLNGGTLQYTGATAASTDRLFSVGLGGGTLDSSSATAATVSFTGTGAMGFNGQAGARNLTLTGTNTGVNILASVIGDNGGPTTLTKSGAGLWVLTGDNTYTGMTTITAGTLRVGNGGTTGSLGTGAVNLAGVLVFNRSDNYTVNNSIFGNGSSTINQASANVLSLAGVGNNTGGLRFTVDGGTIDIMGNDLILTGTSALTTANSGTINATGGGRILLGVANADYGAASNKTLVINAVIADGTFTTIDFHGGTNSSGITTLTADNIFTGSANIQGQAVSVSKIGNAGAAGNLGLNGVINLGTTTQTTSRLLYTGAGETTNRVINLASTTGAAIIDQSGSGVLEFTSDFTAVAGSKFLTLQGSTSGSGRISGAIVNGSGNVGIIKSGTGLWTLAGANTYTGTTTVNAGVLAAGSTSAFGSNSAMTVNVNGTLRLGEFSNTVGSIAGAGLLENGGAANVVLTVGGDGTTTTFSGVVRNGGTGTLSINKTGAGTLTLSASEISYTGSTGVAAGTLLVTGGQGGLATTSVNVAGGASLLLLNQQGQYLDLGSGPLNLGAGAGSTTLGLELGTGTLTSDGFKTSGAAVVANQVVLSLVGIQGFGTSSFYDVLTAGSGLNAATYSLSAYVPGGYTYGLDVTSTRVRVNLAAMAAGTLYWKGGVVGGALNSWSALVGGQSNWTTDAAGAVNANGTPGAQHSVIFSATTAAGPAISTTLDNHVSIQDLTFAPSPNGVTSVTVAPGSQPFYTLTLSPVNAASGIEVQSNAGSVSITAPVVLGASQTWQVAGTGTNGSSLAVTGGISGNAGITKTGTGVLTLGTATYTGDTVISAGTVMAGAASSFSAASAHTLGAGTILRLNGFSGNIGSLSGSGTVENNHASTAVVLTAGANNQSTTFSGVLRNGGVGTLGLTKTGNGTLTLTGLNTYTGPTVVNRGTLLVGTGGSLTGAGALSVIADAGAAAVLDVNGAALTF